MILARIQAHPTRAHLYENLAQALAPLPVEIMVHSSDPPSPWAGYKLALSDLPPAVTHALVIQDDATVCANFPLAVERIAAANPDKPVCLFVPGSARWLIKNYLEAMRSHRPYVDMHPSSFMPVVAVLWPRHKAEEFLEWCQTAKIPGIRTPWRSDDAVAGAWMRLTRQSVKATVPSLVEHPDNVEPVKGKSHRAAFGKDKGRVALWYIGSDDPLEIEWGHSAS